MPILIVTEAGTANHQRIEAAHDYHAVAVAAGCDINDVPLPVWPQLGAPAQYHGARCYMPADGTGRQWLVQDVPATS